ncbi:hypothetical protein [Pantanalinema sp. GBBB05]|uniref:GspE/PulE/PilB domain-containing protein n=1 Tax=Pantanalinema sp. GBBB05 TaxID=2604139 RepID=UPI001DE7EEF9|nr:hypothetical protein [Pantanalinema sp. GBBB05]
MVSPSGDQIEAQNPHPDQSHSLGKPKIDWTTQVDAEQAFRLVDSILPFEACLYHQILPLSLEGSRLKLGMVNMDDTAALDYVRRILAYMNCSLVPHPLASEVHYAALTAYLNYAGKQKAPVGTSAQPVARRIARKLAEESSRKVAEAVSDSNLNSEPAASFDPHTNPTFLVESPELLHPDLQAAADHQVSPVVEPNQSSVRSQPTPPVEASASSSASNFGDVLPSLNIDVKHLSDPLNVLATLPPHELFQELLGRILTGGIGRLYFECQSQSGRILWSQNGVLQSVLEDLPLATVQGVLHELKQLTRLPLTPVQKTRQIEIERLYQGQRLLLRLRIMPGNYGEEATVQVLRGAALKFYQQQQIATLGRDVLETAQELQRKVNQIHTQTRSNPLLLTEDASLIPALDEVLRSVGQQLEALKAMQGEQP